MIRLVFAGLFAAALLMRVSAALAQQQQIDSRIAAPLINTLQAKVQLQDVMIKILEEDAAKREKDWASYSKSLWDKPAKH